MSTPTPSPTPSPTAGPSPRPSPTSGPAPTPSPSPGPAPSPTSGPAGDGGDVTADPDAIRRHGRDVVEKVGPILTKARTALANNPAEEFSEDGIAMTSVYPGAKEFFLKSLESKVAALEKLRDGLDRTADTWERASDKSTVQEA